MGLPRRAFLGSAAGLTAAALAGCVPRPEPSYPPQSGVPFEGEGVFPCGVLSADPSASAVLLWTRVHPERDRGDGCRVLAEVATDPGFGISSVVWSAEAVARPGSDHCVTLDAAGLQPATTYWYRFTHDSHVSRTGRTRTAPVGPTERLRLAAFSCQRYTQGWYTAHADLAGLSRSTDTDIDLLLSLGDYVYDTGYADGVYVPGRDDPVQDALTVDDFRSKYRLYRSDPNLQDVHALYPVVGIFDNHDGLTQPGDPQEPGALRAFAEYMPARGAPTGPLYRSLAWGDMADLLVTDQRSYRDGNLQEDGPLGTSTRDHPEILDPDRTMLGAQQREWLLGSLETSDARWRVIGSQMMFWPWRTLGRFPWEPRGTGTYLNLEQWDGYVAERLAVLDRLEQHDVRDTLMFSGDSHVFSAAQVAPDVDDPGSTPRVLEFGAGSVTSNNADENGFPTDEYTGPFLRSVNPNHLRYFESERHGYAVAELTPSSASVEFRSPSTILAPTSARTDVLARFTVRRGDQRIDRVLPQV